MKHAPRSLVSLLGLFIFLLAINAVTARAQEGVPVGPTTCYVEENGRKRQVPCPDSDSGSGSSAGSGVAGARLRRWADCKFFGKDCPAKIDKRKEAAHELNVKGLQAYEREDWAAAATYFEQALKNSPHDPVLKKNVAHARAWLAKEAAEREATERQGKEKAAAANMRQAFNDFADRLTAAPTSSAGLDFISAAPTPSPAKPTPALEPGAPRVVDALQQLREVKAASEKGANTSGDATKPLSGQRFDTPDGPPASDLPQVAAPRPVNWEQIPKRLQNDPEFKAMSKQWEELESQERAVDTQLAKVKEEKSKPGADKSKLEMQEVGLKEERNQVGYKKLIVEKKISFAVDVAEKEETPKAPPANTSTPATPPQ